MSRQLYVYYRVAEAELTAVTAAAVQLQASLAREVPGLQAELLRRPEAANGLVTLMETYRRAEGIDAALQARIEAAAMAALSGRLIGERHVEVFEPLR